MYHGFGAMLSTFDLRKLNNYWHDEKSSYYLRTGKTRIPWRFYHLPDTMIAGLPAGQTLVLIVHPGDIDRVTMAFTLEAAADITLHLALDLTG